MIRVSCAPPGDHTDDFAEFVEEWSPAIAHVSGQSCDEHHCVLAQTFARTGLFAGEFSFRDGVAGHEGVAHRENRVSDIHTFRVAETKGFPRQSVRFEQSDIMLLENRVLDQAGGELLLVLIKDDRDFFRTINDVPVGDDVAIPRDKKSRADFGLSAILVNER